MILREIMGTQLRPQNLHAILADSINSAGSVDDNISVFSCHHFQVKLLFTRTSGNRYSVFLVLILEVTIGLRVRKAKPLVPTNY
jgi:hypothetical protein